jgi:hypothetical protein
MPDHSSTPADVLAGRDAPPVAFMYRCMASAKRASFSRLRLHRHRLGLVLAHIGLRRLRAQRCERRAMSSSVAFAGKV